MLYQKPKDMSYTQMCIFIDNTLYTDTRDDELVFEYLYHILKMLAVNNCLCQTQQEYEDFAVFSASKVFSRILNCEKQVKSILNYCKASIHFLRVDFEYFEGRVLPDPEKSEAEVEYNFDHVLSKRLESLEIVEFRLLLKDVPSMVKFHMKNLPFIEGTNEYVNIYTSIVLTMVNRLTFSRKGRKRLDNLMNKNRLHDKELRQLFHREKYDDVVIFHLPDSMYKYIDIVVRQIMHSLAKELSDALRTRVSSDWDSISIAATDYSRSINYVNKD